MKIVYCLNSIRYLGGIQRVTITKANALADISGNKVYILVSDNNKGMQTQSLSDKVHLINLGINYYDGDNKRSRIANFLVSALKRKKHRKLLYHTLCRINPDVVVSVGQSEKYMLLSMKNRSWKVIREFHFDRNYRKELAQTKIDKLIAWAVDFYDFSFKEKKYDRIVVLTEEDKATNWKEWNNVSVIPNPVAFVSNEISKLNNNVIVTLGRLENQKNYSSLINSFKIINRIHPNWLLEIYGSGSQQEKLQLLIDELKLRDRVYLKGTINNVIGVLTNASIFALSSIMEGLPLVLIEAMECGLPVVSYQCPCGPKDIITNGVDGFLVHVGDEQMMADRICTLIEDEDLRRKMGAAAKEKAKKYHIDNIIKQWMNLFEELVNR